MLAAASAATREMTTVRGSPCKNYPGIREVLQRSPFFGHASHEFIDAVVESMTVQKFNAGDEIHAASGQHLAVLELGEWWLEDGDGTRELRSSARGDAPDLTAKNGPAFCTGGSFWAVESLRESKSCEIREISSSIVLLLATVASFATTSKCTGIATILSIWTIINYLCETSDLFTSAVSL